MGISHDSSISLPSGVAEILRRDAPRLGELRHAYAALDWPVCTHTLWASEVVSREVKLPWFRGDNAFVWQRRQLRTNFRRKLEAILQYLEARDELGLLSQLEEDGLFGCWAYRFPTYGLVSRDLLDSVNEINFLERQLRLSQKAPLSILDIGAGYGRLAHRMCTTFANISRYDCVDAVAESTFLCEYYLGFRGVNDRARVVPLPDVNVLLAQTTYDLAINVHSFPECTYEAIAWWAQRLSAARIPWLFIVPNHPELLLSTELDGSARDFAPLLEKAGYVLICKEPVYNDPKVLESTGVRDQFFLFRHKTCQSNMAGNS